MYAEGTGYLGVNAHYAQQDLENTILAAVDATGRRSGELRPEHLAAIDQFHVRGRKATSSLARDLDLGRDMQVLDVGCGLGGAARYLAWEYGCRVTGLDLSAEYCRVAAGLSQRLGLEGQVSFLQGNALDLPFPDASFDVVWTQHAAMNIADKSGLYREMWRVLKPGGRLAINDVLAGPGGEIHYPVPWARESSTSFLQSSRELLHSLREIGFRPMVWRDVTDAGRRWFREVTERMHREGAPPLGLHLLLGPEFPRMALNQHLNLEEDRIALIEAVLRRPFDA